MDITYIVLKSVCNYLVFLSVFS